MVRLSNADQTDHVLPMTTWTAAPDGSASWASASDGSATYGEPENDQDYVEDDYVMECYTGNAGSWDNTTNGSASWAATIPSTTSWL